MIITRAPVRNPEKVPGAGVLHILHRGRLPAGQAASYSVVATAPNEG
jgi:hypothetical protein